MREFHDRRLWRRVFFSSASVLTLAVLLFFAVRGLIPIYERYTQAKALRYAAEARSADLEERKSELETAVEELGSPRGFEAEVRKRYGVVLPGEGVIQIVDTPVPEAAPLEKQSFLERILNLF